MKLTFGAPPDFGAAISVPGATTSGLNLISSQGPLLLNPANAFGLPDTFSLPIGEFGNELSHALLCVKVE